MNDAPLHGHRILVVEDDVVMARRFTRMLREAGADVVGPVDTVDGAERLILVDGLSAAWLDVWIEDGTTAVWPVASVLADKGIPFLFCTQVPDDVDSEAWPGHPVIAKQIFTERNQRSIVATIAGLIASRTPPAAP